MSGYIVDEEQRRERLRNPRSRAFGYPARQRGSLRNPVEKSAPSGSVRSQFKCVGTPCYCTGVGSRHVYQGHPHT